MIGVIAPWNYPFHNVYNHIISGIFAGNAVVSKVSEYTCWSSRCGGGATTVNSTWLCTSAAVRAPVIMPLFLGEVQKLASHQMRHDLANGCFAANMPCLYFYSFAFVLRLLCLPIFGDVNRYFTAIMSEVLKACGHNPDLCLTVTGFGDAGAALVASPNVDKIIFTGSPQV